MFKGLLKSNFKPSNRSGFKDTATLGTCKTVGLMSKNDELWLFDVIEFSPNSKACK